MQTIFSPSKFTKVEFHQTEIPNEISLHLNFYRHKQFTEGYALNTKIEIYNPEKKDIDVSFTGERTVLVKVGDHWFHIKKTRKNNWTVTVKYVD